jgi:nitrate/TMAO reductase-like tetraheme cytochrome c subunit
MMPEALKNGLTCIDCHKGIAHHLPKEEDARRPDELAVYAAGLGH